MPRTSRTASLRRASVVFILALAAPSCSSRPDARLDVGYFARGSYADPIFFRAEVTQGNITRSYRGETMGGVRTLPASSLQLAASGIGLNSRQPVTVDLHVGPAESVVTKTVTWVPEDEIRYSITAYVDTIRPIGFCMWIDSRQALPTMTNGARDSLFIIRGEGRPNTVC